MSLDQLWTMCSPLPLGCFNSDLVREIVHSVLRVTIDNMGSKFKLKIDPHYLLLAIGCAWPLRRPTRGLLRSVQRWNLCHRRQVSGRALWQVNRHSASRASGAYLRRAFLFQTGRPGSRQDGFRRHFDESWRHERLFDEVRHQRLER